jgi:hypothetical protein
VRETIALDLHGTAEMLHKIPRSKNPAHLSKRQGVVDQVATTSEKVFKWNHDSESETIVNVLQISNSVTSNRRSEVSDQKSEVIDVQAEPPADD